MENFEIKYFLGANSCEGFYSVFNDCYSAENGWQAFIIKGGPGTGKSSFMRYIVSKAQDKGVITELCPCSSDPDSLDGVIFPTKKIVILDGTAPHIVDPVYPGACEEVFNFGQFWDSNLLKLNRKKIIEITDKNKLLHKTASRYMLATGQLMADNYKTACACTDKKKTATYAQGLCHRYIPKGVGEGFEWVRFIQGITPKGVVSYSDTILNNVERMVVIDDEYGSASNIIMNRIREYALASGYEIITLKNPFLPSLLTDHIIIPELSIAFVTENEYMHFDSDMRRIHARRFVNNKQLHFSRERIKFNKKAIRQLLISASETLSRAKAVHDELETHYISAMNFDALKEFAEQFTQKLFK